MKLNWLSVPAIAVCLLVTGQANANTDPTLKLARKSGCLACHGLDRKIVGPSWQAIAERYKNVDDARTILINKVRLGGKGAWHNETGGLPMPPYSPRVSNKNIAKLVDFILTR